jgi:hypothetical protein
LAPALTSSCPRASYAQPDDTVTLYAVGLGPLDTASKSCLFPLRIFFGDTDAVVKSVGFGPSLPGFYRVDVIVPEIHSQDRNAVPVRLSIDGTRDFKHLLTAITTHLATQGSALVNDVLRTYTLYVPLTYHSQESALIIGLNGRGAGGPGSAMEFYTDLDDKADREGFAVAYLDGLPDLLGTLNWNYFYSPFFSGASNPPDDVSFVRDVIDALEYKIDPDRSRIFVTGTSAGGFMAQRAGVEVSDRVAAIAAVEGGISVTSRPARKPSLTRKRPSPYCSSKATRIARIPTVAPSTPPSACSRPPPTRTSTIGPEPQPINALASTIPLPYAKAWVC